MMVENGHDGKYFVHVLEKNNGHNPNYIQPCWNSEGWDCCWCGGHCKEAPKESEIGLPNNMLPDDAYIQGMADGLAEKRPAEELFAQALLACEPSKNPNMEGSEERKDWLSLTLQIQEYILTHGLVNEVFRASLLEDN